MNNNFNPNITKLFYIQCATFLFLNVLIGMFSVTVFILGLPLIWELEWFLCFLIWAGYIICCLCLNIFIFRGMSTGFRWGMFILGIGIITISGILFGGIVAEQF